MRELRQATRSAVAQASGESELARSGQDVPVGRREEQDRSDWTCPPADLQLARTGYTWPSRRRANKELSQESNLQVARMYWGACACPGWGPSPPESGLRSAGSRSSALRRVRAGGLVLELLLLVRPLLLVKGLDVAEHGGHVDVVHHQLAEAHSSVDLFGRHRETRLGRLAQRTGDLAAADCGGGEEEGGT